MRKEEQEKLEAPVLDDNVYIGAKASILGNVKIGNGAIISVHTLVIDNVAPVELL